MQSIVDYLYRLFRAGVQPPSVQRGAEWLYDHWPRDTWNLLGVEALLIGVTLILLVQPGFLIPTRFVGTKRVLGRVGIVGLIAVFVWSFFIGVVFTLGEMRIAS